MLSSQSSPIECYRPVVNGMRAKGHLDLWVRFPDSSCLAIEIDRGNKQWSATKLAYPSRQLLAEAIWIRWRGVVTGPQSLPVRVIDLTDIGNMAPATRGRANSAADEP